MKYQRIIHLCRERNIYLHFMSEKTLAKPAMLTLALAVAVMLCWELYLRNQGVSVAYDDGPPLWSEKRAMVYEPSDQAVVFIGSSRIKYDLDIPTWQRLTGTHAIQLAVEGSSPRPTLEDLSNDPHFKGRLIVDVTEGLFFSNAPPSSENPNKNIKYYHDRTPAQRASFQLNRVLESGLVFLDKDHLSLNAQLDALEIPSREGVFMMPIFPMDFGYNTFDRQMYMTDRFVADTNLQNQVKGIWYFFSQGRKGAPPMPAEELAGILQSAKEATDKIKARGGEVLFVRTPSSNPMLMGENMAFPRATHWDQLLALTQCPGIHFADYPSMSHFICPELSHLSPSDAILFTQALIEVLEKDKGWKFSHSKTN